MPTPNVYPDWHSINPSASNLTSHPDTGAGTLVAMANQPHEGMSDDEIRRFHELRAELGRDKAPAGVRPILVAVVLTLVWFVLVGPLTAGTGQHLSSTPSAQGTAQVGDCTRKWTSFWQTWVCDATVTWADGTTATTPLTSPDDVSGQSVAVVVRHSTGRFNTNSGEYNAGAAHVVTQTHPHDDNGWNNSWVLAVVGTLTIWIVAGVVISRRSRR